MHERQIWTYVCNGRVQGHVLQKAASDACKTAVQEHIKLCPTFSSSFNSVHFRQLLVYQHANETAATACLIIPTVKVQAVLEDPGRCGRTVISQVPSRQSPAACGNPAMQDSIAYFAVVIVLALLAALGVAVVYATRKGEQESTATSQPDRQVGTLASAAGFRGTAFCRRRRVAGSCCSCATPGKACEQSTGWIEA